jgi:nucleoside-diphosphate-sugar epimerase
VDDAVEALLAVGPAPETHGAIYNQGHGEILTLLEFVEILTRLCPGSRYRIVPFPEDAKRIDIGDYYGSYERIRSAIGWEPRVSVAEGLARTVAYYRENLEHYLQ